MPEEEDEIYFGGKQILISTHTVIHAREREIAYPDQVYATLRTGKIERFGKNFLKFVKRGKQGSIICIGEDIGEYIIIRTIERGN